MPLGFQDSLNCNVSGHLFESDLTLKAHLKVCSHFPERVTCEFISLDFSVSLVGCCDWIERKQESEHIYSVGHKQV